MNYDEKTEVLKRMEYIVAKHCSTGTYNIGDYRYPVCFRRDGKKVKNKGNGTANVSMNEISSMHYEFGAHRLDIGKALLEIMDYLENRNYDAFNDIIYNPDEEY